MTRHKRNRVYIILSWVAILFIVAASSLIIFWLVFPYKRTTIKEPIPILNPNKEIAVGEPILQRLEINKPTNTPPNSVTRVLICNEGELITLAPSSPTLNLPVGKYISVNDRYDLPENVTIGSTCHFIWTQSYEVNPIRNIDVEWRSEQFKVVKG